MQSLEDLRLCNIPLTSFPITLKSLKYEGKFDSDTQINILKNLPELSKLESLQLSFQRNSNFNMATDSSGKLLGIQFEFPRLHTFHFINYTKDKVVEYFCSAILRNCSSLEHVILFGVSISNRDLLCISTQSLQTLVLTNHENTARRYQVEQLAVIDATDYIQWSSLVNLLERNAKIYQLELCFGKRLSLVSYQTIERISAACRHLSKMEIYKNKTDVIEESPLTGSLYTADLTSHQLEIAEIMTEMIVEKETGETRFTVDLDRFRKIAEQEGN